MGIQFLYKGKSCECYGSVFVCIAFPKDLSSAIYITEKDVLLNMWPFNKVTYIIFCWLYMFNMMCLIGQKENKLIVWIIY